MVVSYENFSSDVERQWIRAINRKLFYKLSRYRYVIAH